LIRADGAGKKAATFDTERGTYDERAKVANRTVKDVMIREVVSVDSSTNWRRPAL
jgi:hypothetical protein